MAETSRPDRAAPAEPPGGGRQDHDVMRAASMRPITGPASTDTLAAGGGLDVPGREPHPELATSAQSPAAGTRAPHELIPGERDPGNLTHREPGAVSGQFAGADIPSAGPQGWMDDRTAAEHAREGGGKLVPHPGPDTEAVPGERASGGDQEAPQQDQRPGSQTGTIGGGADAHDPAPVRATNADDPTTPADKTGKKRTTKKY